MYKICFFLLFLFTFLSGKMGHTIDFGKHFYGHAFGYFGVGFGYQGGSIPMSQSITRFRFIQQAEEWAREEWEDQFLDKEKYDNDVEKYVKEYIEEALEWYNEGDYEDGEGILTKALLLDVKFVMPIGIGYNFYWKAFEKVHFFVGFDLSHTLIPYSINETKISDLKNKLLMPMAKEIITTYLRVGLKYVKSDLFAFQFYGLVGFTYDDVRIKFEDYLAMNDYHKKLLGFSTGGGMEFIFSEKWIIGLEYRFLNTKTESINLVKLGDIFVKFNIENHYIIFKFGYQFL